MLRLLAEGPGWVAVAKPPLLLVHRSGFGGPHEDALLQRLRDQLGVHVNPVHRLDRPASGIVLFTTDPTRTAPLQAALADGDKRYLALVRGVVRVDEARVETPMRDERGVIQEAASAVRVLHRVEEPRCSLVEVRTFTGRYHQVRRHLRDLGHPILGDGEHGDYRVNRAWRARGLHRLALHAASLSLPAVGIELRCPLFSDLAEVLVALSLPEPLLPLLDGAIPWTPPVPS